MSDQDFEVELITIGHREFSAVSFKAVRHQDGVLVRLYAAGLTNEIQLTHGEAVTVGEQLVAAGKAEA